MADFVDLLFADQDLDELLVHVELAPLSPLFVARSRLWEGRLAEAKELASAVTDDVLAPLVVAHAEQRAGDVAGAAKTLLALDVPTVDTRMRLWAWRALRDLGVAPPPETARELLGVVIQVPMRTGLDALAAYADGSARYASHAGGVVVHEPGGRIDTAVAEVLYAAEHLTARPTAVRNRAPIPRERIRFTALSRLGLHAMEVGAETFEDAQHPLGKLFFVASRLLVALTTSRPQG
ncbi:MAG: hypothetical protein IT379_13235 [Deltaproteobacteria bacterium]|nr:hypothetical protein [Deltaproteobacteria bacterium]